MASVYPTALKSFQYRQDFTQLVDAADVNVAYDEISAIQSVLGTTPNADNLDGGFQAWPTVRDSIAASKRGVTSPMCKVRVVDALVPFSPNDGSNNATVPNFSSSLWDTHGMWTGGSQLICPRTGWYDFQVYSEWQYAQFPYDFNQAAADRTGYVQLGVQQVTLYGGLYITGYNLTILQGERIAARASCSISTPWFKGAPAQITLHQSVHNSPTPVNVYFSATYRRDAPTTNNL